MNRHLEDQCDKLDASVFSGDGLHNDEALGTFMAYLDRWARESRNIKEMLKQRELNNE